MQFVEFLEMLGRLAEIKYTKKDNFKQLTFVTKVELLLDEVFQRLLFCKRNEVTKKDEMFSDDD